MLEILKGKSLVASQMASLTQTFGPLSFYLGVTSGYKQAVICKMRLADSSKASPRFGTIKVE